MDSIYREHLELQSKEEFFTVNVKSPTSPAPPAPQLLTNFGITLANHFSYLLLHLRKQTGSKNVLAVQIPDICIFYKGTPYELLFSESGDVRSRGREGLRMGQVFNFFRSRSQKRGYLKEEPSLACFEEDCLMLSDTDLFICCRKFRNDPFFSKLQYLRNKVGSGGDPIAVEFQAQKECELAGAAVEGLRGVSEPFFLREMGQQKYLKYLCFKISLFLTFESNIRLSRGRFLFSKTAESFTLIDAHHLQFENLTFALRQRELRLQAKQEERDRALLMNEEKQKRYRSYEGRKRVKEIQGIMDGHWEVLADRVRVPTDYNRKREEEKNQLAMSVLFGRRSSAAPVGGSPSQLKGGSERKVLGGGRRQLVRRRGYLADYSLSVQKRHITEPCQQVDVTIFSP